MILHSKPIAYGMGDRCYNDWHYRGSIDTGSDSSLPEKEKEENEFFSEEEFKL